MDRSIDSIGSCSLDVEADSSDISDTSGSLNFPTPLSVKDITREFTANIRERCTIHTVQTNTNIVNAITVPDLQTESVTDKKPSYLNLACCVNGYSNLTTYDSKVRQTINKSREVSPIRPSTSSIQYCKKSNSLAPPVLLKMPLSNHQHNSSSNSNSYNSNNSSHHNNSNKSLNGFNDSSLLDDSHDMSQEEGRNTSFIQQRVERLYGPGALAQGFYSPKKLRGGLSPRNNISDEKTTSELSQKFQQLLPSSRDYTEFRNKLNSSTQNYGRINNSVSAVTIRNQASNSLDNDNVYELPVLRHLSQEFRDQLPTISPKKNITRNSPIKETKSHSALEENSPSYCQSTLAELSTTKAPIATVTNSILNAVVDEIDHQVIKPDTTKTSINLAQIHQEDIPPADACNIKSKESGAMKLEPTVTENTKSPNAKTNTEQVKDGNYFLTLHQNEKTRLLVLAEVVEKYTEALETNPEISEEVLGILRSASGKARLLVAQKLKQFEGLCHNNLNRSPEDKFPTTIDDLQGFWDMVYLQVDHIDALFKEVEVLKANDWKVNSMMTASASISTIKPKPSKTVILKPKTSKSNGDNSKSSAAALKRESQRKQLLEMKRKQKLAMANANSDSLTTAEEPSILIDGI